MSDVAAASAYYCDVLGFAVDWLDTGIGLAGVSREHCRLFLAGPAFRDAGSSVAPASTWLNMSSTDDVDALHGAWKSTGAILLSGPESKPWGLREFTVADLDGNRFRVFHDFATPERERTAAT